MNRAFNSGLRATLEEIGRSVPALPNWVRRMGRYVLALLFVAAAVMLRWALGDVLSPVPALVFYLAWVGAAAFGGLGPGLLATAASWLCIDLLFDPTPGHISLADPTSIARLLILLTGGLVVSLVGEKMRRARIRQRESEQKYRAIVETATEGIEVADADAQVVFVNDRWLEMFGYSDEEVRHLTIFDQVFPEDVARLKERWELRKHGQKESYEVRLRRKDGSPLWGLVSVRPRFDPQGKFLGTLVVIADISQQKRAEEELEIRVQARTAQLREAMELVESERLRFQGLLDQLPAYLVLLSADYRVMFANRSFEQRFGKCEGRHCYEYLFHRAEPCENCEAFKVLETNAPQHWEWHGPDGRDYDVHDFPFTDVDGSPLVMEVGLDITERKQVQEALQQSGQRLSLAQQIAHVGTFDWDIRTDVNVWTPELEAMYGLPPGGFAGTEEAWEQLIHPDDRAGAIRLVEQAFETGEPTEGQWRIVWPDGSVHWLSGRWQVLKDESGKPLRMTGVNIDITERVQAEAELVKHREHLEELVQERASQLKAANVQLREQAEKLTAQAEALRLSKQRLSLAQQVAHVGTFDLDMRTGVNVWTPELEAMYGLPPGGFGKTWLAWEQLVHPEDRAEATRLTAQSIDTGEPTEGQWRVVWPDGSVHWLAGRWQVFKDESGKPCRMTGVNIDITERVQAEEALRESEERFRALTTASSETLYRMSPDWSEMRELHSRGFLANTETPSRTWLEQYIHPDDQPHVMAVINEAIRTKSIFELEHRVWRTDGTLGWTFSRAVPLLDANGEIIEWFGAAIDVTERKRVQEALRESEQRYRRLFEATVAGAYITKPDGTFLDVNDAMMRMLGYDSREELFQHRSTEFYADPEVRDELMRRLQKDGIVPITEAVLRRKDGSNFYAFGSGVLLTDERTGEFYILGVAIDITERKQAEEALRQSERQFKSTFENAAIGIAHVALDGHILQFNRRFCEIAGYLPDDIVGKTCEEITFADDWKAEKEQLQRLLDGQVDHYSIEKRYIRTDGRPIWVNLTRSIQRDEAGQPEYFIVLVEDISARKRAEQALRASEQRYRKLFEANLAGVYLVKPDGTILDFNDAMMRMLGFDSREELLQHRTPDFYVDLKLREELIRLLYKDGVVLAREAALRRKDGSILYALGSAVLLTDEKTGEAYIQGVSVDITERKRMEEALRELTATLEAKVTERTKELRLRARQLQKLTLDMSETEDRERKRMAEILHDDLQQQIAGAKFHLAQVRSRARYDPSLQTTITQVDHMLKEAIEKSRGLSHELSPTVLHHADFADTLRWLANEVHVKHGLTVHVHTRGPIHSQSDALKGFLYKAAQELLFNVVKHARVNRAEIRVRQCRRYICLSISDHGRGFDPEELRETTGYGLLSIREQIELLGGRMKIKSAPGKGSTFYIVVPEGEIAGTGSRDKAKPNGRTKAVEAEKGRLRVLLADDHELVREGLRSLLSDEHDVEVVGEASNGREAVDLATRLEPDVIIMDVSMPVIDGDEATRQIKTQLPQTRVIALSMYDEPGKIETMYRVGAESYVLKTSPSEELLTAIRGQGDS